MADADNCGSYQICVRSEESGKVTQLDSIPCPCGAMFNTSTALSGAPCIQADEKCPSAMAPENDGKINNYTSNKSIIIYISCIRKHLWIIINPGVHLYLHV